MAGFADTILEFKGEAMERADRVFRTALQDLAEDVTKPRTKGGRMRVDTGFLRASFQVTLNNPVLSVTYNPNDGSFFTFNESASGLTINSAKMGDTVYFTFTANYARPREYGARGQPPDAFVATYANPVSWQGYVDRAKTKVSGPD